MGEDLSHCWVKMHIKVEPKAQKVLILDEAKGTEQLVGASLESLKLSAACMGTPQQAFTFLGCLIIAMNLQDSVQIASYTVSPQQA